LPVLVSVDLGPEVALLLDEELIAFLFSDELVDFIDMIVFDLSRVSPELLLISFEFLVCDVISLVSSLLFPPFPAVDDAAASEITKVTNKNILRNCIFKTINCNHFGD
jgi:hypothetical protein